MIPNIKSFILKGDYLIKILSSFYPLSESLIEKYKDLWDWGSYGNEEYRKGLSGNEMLPWNIELVNRYDSRWNWHYENLSLTSNIVNVQNENLKEAFFNKYSNDLDWLSIAQRKNLNWSLDFISIYNKYSYLGLLSSNTSIPWCVELIDKYIEKWDWKELSQNESLPWSIGFIDTYKDKWDWNSISENKLIPLSIELIKHFYTYWNWNRLSTNINTNWSISILYYYKDELNWDELSDNKSLPWSLFLIKRFEKKWNLFFLGWNSTIEWNIELVDYLLENGDTGIRKYDVWGSKNMYSALIDNLSSNPNMFWNINLLERFKKNLNWKKLSANKSLPWSEELIDKYIRVNYSWNWKELSANESLPWTVQLIEKYIDKWDWVSLSANTALPWSIEFIKKYIDKWDWKGSNDSVYYGDLRYGININKGIFYDYKLIKEFEDLWNWEYLSMEYGWFIQSFVSKEIYWSVELLTEFAHKWDWSELQENETIYALLFSDLEELDIEYLMEYYKTNRTSINSKNNN